MKAAAAIACSNVALAKYWGKRDERLNLPYMGSLSITMAGLTTMARFEPRTGTRSDRVVMNGAEAEPREGKRIVDFLDLVRAEGGIHGALNVAIDTNFPVAAGIASSASTFAALAVGATAACELSLTDVQLSVLARRGSGSAARSIFGGFVEWLAGGAEDGSDSYAVQIAPPEHWALGVVVAVTDAGRKRVGSREGMAQAVRQSPFFPSWLETHWADLDTIRQGILERDLGAVGAAAEHNCLKMHAVSMAAIPGLLYWAPATVAVLHRVRELRETGVEAYFTIDAGPQVKVICAMGQRATVADAIAAVPGVQRVLLSEPGPGARLLEAA